MATVQISDEQHLKITKLATTQGKKIYSIVDDAIAAYLVKMQPYENFGSREENNE